MIGEVTPSAWMMLRGLFRHVFRKLRFATIAYNPPAYLTIDFGIEPKKVKKIMGVLALSPWMSS
jgi:hypothetical protein